MSDDVSFRSPHGRIVYEDSRDHFENGFLRLLQLDVGMLEQWLAAAEDESSPDLMKALGAAFARWRPVSGSTEPPHGAESFVEPGPNGESGSLWHPRIAESPGHGVARAHDGSLAWLVRLEGNTWLREQEPPLYEESYFEGDPREAGGYGDYAAQSGWRLEKAKRQVRELEKVAGLQAGHRALDVGSGYGFFRRALEEAGIAHEGLEISRHARAMARALYGFESAEGDLAEHRSDWGERFDLVSLWDMLEHVADPIATLGDVAACLRPGGIAAIKTPNIDCPEAEVFGAHYHSLKREHLVYFAINGLHRAARAVGLEPFWSSSNSHLLAGFVGAARVSEWGAALRGADLVVYFRKIAR
jgi:2-polyprenyl-3-methyl-5-hydroxy-6-metoxy-1,4-benzoquinol methylase